MLCVLQQPILTSMAWVWIPSTAGDALGVEDDSVQIPRTIFSNQLQGCVLCLAILHNSNALHYIVRF
jgi:hypothetical protein